MTDDTPVWEFAFLAERELLIIPIREDDDDDQHPQ